MYTTPTTHDRVSSAEHLSPDQQELLELLLSRLRTAPDKRAIQGLLRAVNEECGLRRGELRVTGNKMDLLGNVRDAANTGLLPLSSLAAFVDRLEENGGQHLFLFDLTPEGCAELTPLALEQAFPPAPSNPTAAMYAALPDLSRFCFLQRQDALIVKQIHAVTFWEKDDNRSFSNETERATVFVRRQHRALNLLRVLPSQRQAEIRIDRVSDGIGDKDIREHLSSFLRALEPILDASRHLSPTPIWNGFANIASWRDGTYMSVDGAEDSSVKIQISNRRAGGFGSDVRDHSSYQFSEDTYVRDQLNVYWDTERLVGNRDPERGDPARVHTILSRFKLDAREYGKVYVAATVSPEVLSSVTEHIRNFAR